jgi:hypothetical protein
MLRKNGPGIPIKECTRHRYYAEARFHPLKGCSHSKEWPNGSTAPCVDYTAKGPINKGENHG